MLLLWHIADTTLRIPKSTINDIKTKILFSSRKILTAVFRNVSCEFSRGGFRNLDFFGHDDYFLIHTHFTQFGDMGQHLNFSCTLRDILGSFSV